VFGHQDFSDPTRVVRVIAGDIGKKDVHGKKLTAYSEQPTATQVNAKQAILSFSAVSCELSAVS
jgi:hypothetical protein